MKLVKACIAMAAFAAFFVVPSIASASPELTVPTGTTAAVGSNIVGTNTGVTKMTLVGQEPVECDEAFMTGKVVTNTGTHVLGEITTAEFRGTPGEKTPTVNAHCKSPLGNVTVTPSKTSNVIHNNVNSLPWCITSAGSKNTFEVWAKPSGAGETCHSATKRKLTFALHSAIGVKCSYENEAAVISGTYTTHPSDAVLTITNQRFLEVPATASVFCPNTGDLDMSFTLETESGAAIYIS